MAMRRVNVVDRYRPERYTIGDPSVAPRRRRALEMRGRGILCVCECVKVEISLLGSSRKEKSAERKFTKRKEMADAKLQHRLSDILMPGAGVA